MPKKLLYGTRVWFAVCTVLCAILIFQFSGQTGETSGALSEEVTDVAVAVVNASEQRVSPDRSSESYQMLHFLVRKTAHFTVYALLGFHLCGLLCTDRRGRKYWWLAPVVACVYAASDEWHQSFVAARGPSVRDVMIDTAGALCGALLLLALFAIWRAAVTATAQALRERETNG